MQVAESEGDKQPLSICSTAALGAAGACLIAVCYGLARFAYGLYLPAFQDDLELGSTASGVIAAASYAAYCVGIAASTALTARFGARTVAVSAGLLATAGCAAIAAAPSALVLGIGVTVAGSSTGVASPPLARAVADHVAARRQDRVQTVVNAGTGFGVAVSGPVALLTHEHWRAGWWAFALAAAVVSFWTWKAVPAGPIGAARSAGAEGQGEWRGLFPAGAWALLGGATIMGAASTAGWTFGPALLQDAGGHGPSLTTAAWIVLGVCGLAGAAAGDLVARLSLQTAWRVLMIALSGATVVWALWPHSAVVAVVASGVFGAVYIALTGVLLVWGTRLYRGRASTGVGLAFLAIAAGQSLSAFVLGGLADLADLQAAFLAAAGMGVLGGLIRPVRTRVQR